MTHLNTRETDITIIGSGSAAFACAIKAAERGASVTLIEASDRVGGCCVNVGCVPSKMLIRAGELAQHKRQTPFAGLRDMAPVIDHATLLAQESELVRSLRTEKYESVLEANPAIQLVHGQARFRDRHGISVVTSNGERIEYRAEQVLVATGSRPCIPPIAGLRETPYWTSTEALYAPTPPRHLAVIGSSVVALELAQAWRRLGADVTLLARGRLLSREDPALGPVLREAFEAEDIRVLEHTPVTAVRHQDEQFTLTTGNGTVTADRLLVATGRRPTTDSLNLEAIGVQRDARGAIMVDERLKTSVPHIFAAGDCANLPQLVYVAAAAGTRAAINMTGGEAGLDLSITPRVIFTDPQVAAVGLTEVEAEQQGLNAESRELDLQQVPRALVNQDTRGLIKLVADADTGRLLGAQLLAEGAGEVIQSAALAITNGMTVEDLANQLFPYLTMSEALKLCALSFHQDVTKLSCCAG